MNHHLYKTLTLHAYKVAVRKYFSEHGLAFANDPEVCVERAAHDMAITICQRVAGQAGPSRVFHLAVEYPEDWWQAFKERWFPAWAKRRWPVQFTRKTKTVEVGAAVYYPSIAIPDHKAFVEIHVREECAE